MVEAHRIEVGHQCISGTGRVYTVARSDNGWLQLVRDADATKVFEMHAVEAVRLGAKFYPAGELAPELSDEDYAAEMAYENWQAEQAMSSEVEPAMVGTTDEW